jgi:hypothetical protein
MVETAVNVHKKRQKKQNKKILTRWGQCYGIAVVISRDER